MTPPPCAALLPPLKELLAALAPLRLLEGGEAGTARTDAILLLESKAVPEAERNHDLPLFIALQGGTNVGKSTLFNALAGKILSPSMVLASATKHALVYVHESWRRLLVANPFPGLELRELADAKELITGADRRDVVYFRFHSDSRLEGFALVDSPDFDSSLESNAAGAELIAALSDVTIFVTSAEKYRDRVLVEKLRRLLSLKGETLVVFNRVDEDIVFGTLLDDLKEALGAGGDGIQALRVPTSPARHPEDDVRAVLEPALLARLQGLKPLAVKQAVLSRTVVRALDLAEATVSRYATEITFQRELKELLHSASEEACLAYAASFQLALPEETLAIRTALTITELGQFLSLGPDLEKSNHLLGLVGSTLRRTNDTVRRFIVRLSRSNEGTIDGSATAVAEYSQARNLADAEAVLRVLEPLRTRIESFIRGREELSALARGLAKHHFTPQAAVDFAQQTRQRHAATLAAAKNTGENVLAEVNAWIAAYPGKARLLGLGAIAVKVSLGFLLAWSLPVAGGLFSIVTWITFACGYLLAAYGVALLVALRLRRRRKFQASREKSMATTLQQQVVAPLEKATEDLFAERDLKRLTRAIKEVRASWL